MIICIKSVALYHNMNHLNRCFTPFVPPRFALFCCCCCPAPRWPVPSATCRPADPFALGPFVFFFFFAFGTLRRGSLDGLEDHFLYIGNAGAGSRACNTRSEWT